jgi:hypothetical protein
MRENLSTCGLTCVTGSSLSLFTSELASSGLAPTRKTQHLSLFRPGAPAPPLARLHQLRGLDDAKVLKSLGRSSKGRHYRG